VEFQLKPISELKAILNENPAFLKNENTKKAEAA